MKNICFIIFLTIFLLTGCAEKEEQKVVLPQKVAKPSGEQKPTDSTTATQTKETAISAIHYEYNPQGRRDPFKSLIAKAEQDKKKGATPLEQDEIAVFSLKAIVWSGKEYFAMITLPDGKSYTVKKGMRLGLDGGIVHEITKDSVIVRQYLKDRKDAKPKDIILRLRVEEQG